MNLKNLVHIMLLEALYQINRGGADVQAYNDVQAHVTVQILNFLPRLETWTTKNWTIFD